jgi:hypothetical protein
MILHLDELRAIGGWAAGSAERVQSIFQAKAPSDLRPREALEGIREFARGGKRAALLRKLSMAALRAAKEVSDPAATAAARSACMAASSAYLHPLATADQARHILGPAVYAALARELSDGPAAGETELAWAVKQAPPLVSEVLHRFPVQPPGRTRLAALYQRLDTALRRSSVN